MAAKFRSILDSLTDKALQNYKIEPELLEKYQVKRGLRNSDGTGVVAGITDIGGVHGFIMSEGEKVAEEGRLNYRGIDIKDVVAGFQREGRFGFEEVAYLLLMGELPNASELEEFCDLLAAYRALPPGFNEDMILKAPSKDIMNKLARSVLVLYSYDRAPDDTSLKNVMRQSVKLIARFPTMVAYGLQAKRHFFDHQSLYIHVPQKNLSTAENFLYMIRPDNKYTKEEAEILDLCLVLHAEHGGGNNSSFVTRVLTSSGTDTFSAIGGAVGSLKGPKHGGANAKVMAMFDDIKANVKKWDDVDEVSSYIEKIIKKEAFDKTGLVYGMGHAVYTLSDPRAELLKEHAYKMSKQRDREAEYNLYELVERITPDIFYRVKGSTKEIGANVDFYSGFVYDMLGIPPELYTPVFAISRIVGWSAHRIEELSGQSRIIRPAYKSVVVGKPYIPMTERE
ncbi:MAG: citrate/2-methylcitrate synthase [Clostridia bacterium]